MNAAVPVFGANVPFKRLALPTLGKMLQPNESEIGNMLVPFLKAGHVQWKGVDFSGELPCMWASQQEAIALNPTEGDLLICEGGEVGRATLVPAGLPPNTIIQNSLHLVRESAQASARYLRYALSHVASAGWIDLVCNKATIAHLTVEKLRELPIPYWDKSSQVHIANFLDEKTERIDALIAEKERLLVCLEDALEAYALHFITEGLKGESKASSRKEHWLARVPSNWSTPKLGYFAEVGNGATPKREVERYWLDGTIHWVTSSAINDRLIMTTAECVTRAGQSETGLKLVRPGSAIVGLIGQGPTRGMTAKLAIPATVSQNVAYVSSRDSQKVSDDYLVVVLTGLYTALRFLSDGSGGAQGAMNCETLRSFRVPIAPPEEQERIVQAFSGKKQAIEAMQLHVSEHIARLREYRSSLISAVVTGEINI